MELRDYLKPPLCYFVTVPSTWGGQQMAALSMEGKSEAEAAGRFLSYEQLGKIASADTLAARECARIIFNYGTCTGGLEIVTGQTPAELEDEALKSKGLVAVLSYVAPADLPNVVIVYPETMRAVCEHFQPGQECQIVGPGGIMAVYKDGTTIEIETRLGCAGSL